MLFAGEYALPEYYAKGYSTELAECQRYFHRYTVPAWSSLPIGKNEGTGTLQFKTQFNIPPLRMEQPTVEVLCSGSLQVQYVDGTNSPEFTVSEIGDALCKSLGHNTRLELRNISVLTSWKYGALTALN